MLKSDRLNQKGRLWVVIPNSRIVVQTSTLWWQMEHPRDTRPFRAPDVVAQMTFSDYANNVDPVMTAISKARQQGLRRDGAGVCFGSIGGS